ncbi:MAG: TMEM175 family protein [Terricaulis sp.]
MEKDRLLAFSDGVIAIIITIMVLELRPPHEATLEALQPLAPVFLSYVLSFAYVAIYWNNHHHMMATVERVNGAILWANMLLLFFLSLLPFSTAWLGEAVGAKWPTITYGVSLLMPALAYTLLQNTIIAAHGKTSTLARAVGDDWKGKTSLLLYITGIALAFAQPRWAHWIFVAVALIWLVPDKRIERVVAQER